MNAWQTVNSLIDNIIKAFKECETNDISDLEQCIEDKLIYNDDIFDVLRMLADTCHGYEAHSGTFSLYGLAFELLHNYIVEKRPECLPYGL